MTEYRPYPHAPYRKYVVSSDGQVKRVGGEWLIGQVDRYGYRSVLLSYAGLSRRFRVHRLVCEAFHGPCPEGHQAAHLDGDKLNNRSENLAWVTGSENSAHKKHQGRPNGGRSTRLAPEALDAIRSSNQPVRKIGAEFGISAAHVSRIRNGLKCSPKGNAR